MENFGIAVKGFIIKENKVLIIKRSGNSIQSPGVWEIPGGRVENNNEKNDELKREVMEETGIEIEIGELINTQQFIRVDGQNIKMFIYLCKPLSDKIKLSHEHTDYEWIDISDAKSKLTEFFHKEVDIFLERFA